MEQIFVRIGEAFEGSHAIGLGAAFVWGILSVLLSPCHLASIPLIVGVCWAERSKGQVARLCFVDYIFSWNIGIDPV